jgi:hypothetical protein
VVIGLHASNPIRVSAPCYSLQSVRKKLVGANQEDRDLQFRFSSNSVTEFQEKGGGREGVSINAKKKEAIGAFHNKGKEW